MTPDLPLAPETTRTGEILPTGTHAVDRARERDTAPHTPGLAAEAALAIAQTHAERAAAPATPSQTPRFRQRSE